MSLPLLTLWLCTAVDLSHTHTVGEVLPYPVRIAFLVGSAAGLSWLLVTPRVDDPTRIAVKALIFLHALATFLSILLA